MANLGVVPLEHTQVVYLTYSSVEDNLVEFVNHEGNQTMLSIQSAPITDFVKTVIVSFAAIPSEHAITENQFFTVVQTSQDPRDTAINSYHFKILLEYYKKPNVTLSNENCSYWRIVRDATPMRIPLCNAPPTCYGAVYPIDEYTLETYKTTFVSFISGSWVVKENCEPIVLMLSCFTAHSKFKTAYMNFINQHKVELAASAIPFVHSADPSPPVPIDISFMIGHIILLSVCKNTTPQFWNAFLTGRLRSLKAGTNKVGGRTLIMSSASVDMVTEKLKNIPKMREFLHQFFSNPENITSSNEVTDFMANFANHTYRLCKNKGLTTFGLVKDFLNEPLTAAHFMYVNAEEVLSFLQKCRQLENLSQHEQDHLFFFKPSSCPIMSEYPQLVSLVKAVGISRGTKSLENLKTKIMKQYPGLDRYLSEQISGNTKLDDLARAFNLTGERAAECNKILSALRVGTISNAYIAGHTN